MRALITSLVGIALLAGCRVQSRGRYGIWVDRAVLFVMDTRSDFGDQTRDRTFISSW